MASQCPLADGVATVIGCAGSMSNLSGQIREALSEALAPIVEAGGGQVYLSELSDDELLLHWAGRYAGSPACCLLHDELALPIIHRIAPGVVVKWSSGHLIPNGAELIRSGNGHSPCKA